MYPFLLRFFRRPLANALMVLWYLCLLGLVLYFVSLPPGLFRYANW